MESHEAIKKVDAVAPAGQEAGQDAWERCVCDVVNPVMNRLKRRPLFQKVVIANTGLMALGALLGLYLENRYFADGQLGFLVLFVVCGVTLSVLVNYLLVKLAFRPLDDVTGTMHAIRAGHRGIRVPEATDDPQIEELSKSLNSMLNSIELQRKRAAASVIRAQEEERKRIARELHDETSQSLTGLVIGIRMVEEIVPNSLNEIRERLDNISELAHSTLNEVHTMAIRLRPSVLDDLGLSAAMRSYAKEFSENTGIQVDLQLLGMVERLPPEMETVLYRVAQEALTNVARHSQARSCSIMFSRRDARVEGRITDNGRGFDAQMMMSESGSGLGLHGMKERIELVGGTLGIDSAPGRGSTVFFEVPMENKEGIW